ncbi:MAG: hypothetical protein AAB559_00680 [Patescibacteria group bacterium]
MIFKKIIILLIIFFCSVKTVSASDNKFITIVNPVRISRYTTTSSESLKSEYKAVKKYGFPATWLLTYDALNNKDIIDEIRKMDTNQEFGIFLEVTKTFASESGVGYHDSGFWHHASAVFLSGYTQEERTILIDKVFDKFKQEFGIYPKSIGSWWTDGYSLSYIKDKYGIVANLVCADQFSTDGYQLWGQPWQIAYYPRETYPAVPASSIENKLDLVNIQWAPRDPLNGYNSSLYSTQDYLVTENTLDINYFNKLLDLYLNTNGVNQITVGLEADLDPAGYSGEFLQQMDVVKKYLNEGAKVVTMTEFYNHYKEKYPNISSGTQIKSKDLLGEDVEAVWYNSPFYRLHYTKDIVNNIIQIKDIRTYGKNLIDPYFASPNYEFNLSINIPSIIDTVQNPEDVWILPSGAEIITNNNSFVIKGKNIKIPNRIKKDPLINLIINKNEIEINFNSITFNSNEGQMVKGFSSEALHFFKAKKSILKLMTGVGWDYFKKIDYLIPQGEIYALSYLKSLPQGKVMVFDNECLQCSWHTKNKPIVFANLRNYIKEYSKHSIVYNSSVYKAKTIEEAQKEFKKVNAKYVYLIKFEEYKEKLPFSPGDLGIRKIYSNANAEIWEVSD